MDNCNVIYTAKNSIWDFILQQYYGEVSSPFYFDDSSVSENNHILALSSKYIYTHPTSISNYSATMTLSGKESREGWGRRVQ